MKQLIFILILILSASCKEEVRSKNDLKFSEKEKIEIPDSIFNEDDEYEKLRIKKQKERLYHITIHEYDSSKDTIVNFDFLESDETLDFSFDYKPFENKIQADTLSMLDTNMEVVIVKSKFDQSNSHITYDKDSTNVLKINNHYLIGADTIPREYISQVYLRMGGNVSKIDKKYYEDLYEPDFNRAKAYYYDNEIIIEMNNSDGYLGYSVNLFIDRFKNIKRIVYIP